MKTSLVVDALRMAIANEHPSPGLIFHSDQGSQYCSHVFQEFLLHQGISGSMSERGQ
jgi:putative transposase